MKFTERKIDVTFQLASDQFGSGGDTVSVSGLRCEALIDNINGISLGSLQLRIYGMHIDDMNKLSTLGKRYLEAKKNIVTVTAGDDESGMAQVFKGTIFNGYIDYAGMPDVAFVVVASSAYLESVMSTDVISHPGATDVASVISAIAGSIGFTFRNNGVTAQLDNIYLEGSPVTQITCAAQYARIACSISNGSVSIWPNGGTIDNQVVDISPATGLVGYPQYSQYGIDVTTLFNPNLVNGCKAKVTSDAVGASGDWYVQVVRHDLASQVSNGRWFTMAQLTGEGFYVAH
jgi:hypothetical protein